MKKLFTILLLLLIPISIYILYTQPILLNINPFFTAKYITRNDGEEEISEYFRKDIVPQVKAELPEGWSIRTVGMRMVPEHLELDGSTVNIKGLTEINIYKDTNEVSYLIQAPILFGGPITNFYKFPDYDPEMYEDFLSEVENIPETEEGPIWEVTEVKEGEYTETDILGVQVRRVGNVYIPNESSNPEKHFGHLGTLIQFSFDNPVFEYCHYYDVDYQDEREEFCKDTYLIYAKEDLSEEDLLILDSILESMEVR